MDVKKYGKLQESIIIQSTLKRLRDSFIGKTDYLFMGCIQYINPETFMSGPKHSLDSFMRKGMTFKDENELRITLYDNIVCHGVYKSVDVATLIEQIICHPNSSDDYLRKVGKLLIENSLDLRVKKSEIS